MSEYTVTMHPPEYPDRLHPWTCRHDPKFKVCADGGITKGERGRNHIWYEHVVCLGCGAPAHVKVDGHLIGGGNVLVDLTQVCAKQTRFLPMFQRAWHLRNRWIRLAVKLFGPDGWNGRHERVARTIDPHLTMRMEVLPDGGMARCWFDSSYLRCEQAETEDQPAPKPKRKARPPSPAARRSALPALESETRP